MSVSYMKTKEEKKECEKCHSRLIIWSIIASILLSIMKGVIGILGSCESLVADGLYSFYQSFIAIKSVWLTENSAELNGLCPVVDEFKEFEQPKKYSCLYLTGLIVGVILFLGLLDVSVFSIIRIFKASKGFLVKPSPYAIYASIISILINQVLYKYSLCVHSKSARTGKTINQDLTDSLRFSMIISSVVLAGVYIARYFSVYGDAVAALIVTIGMASSVINLLKENIKKMNEAIL